MIKITHNCFVFSTFSPPSPYTFENTVYRGAVKAFSLGGVEANLLTDISDVARISRVGDKLFGWVNLPTQHYDQINLLSFP